MTALALRDDQTRWDEQQLAVLHQTGIDTDVSDAELAAFLHECQRRKLDPFTRQIYLIGRYDKRKGRKVYRSQTSIDGFRLIARRAADKSGIDYSYEDTIWFDADGGRHEIWLSEEPPAGAKVVVIRNGCRFDAVARYGAYVQVDQYGKPSGQWRSMADVMVAKCAEALALRKAFPEDLGGIYTEEEMAQADNPQRVQGEVIRDEPTVTVVHEGPAPVREAQVVTTDEGWFGTALASAGEFATEKEGRKLWLESATKVRAGECTKADAARVQEVLTARFEELRQKAAALDPDDPWAAKVDGLADGEEAAEALAELAELVTSGDIDEARETRVRNAILARFPHAAGETQVAA